MMKKRLLWVTRTAVFIALLLAVQFVSKAAGQFVTGSLVNLVLLTAALTAGLASGLTVAVLSPFFAFFMGIGPAFIQIVPAVAVGNAVIVLVVWFVCSKALDEGTVKGYALAAGGFLAGAGLKFLALWLLIVKLLLPIIPGLKPKQIEVLSASFSWPQLVTALIGGVVALILVPVLRKALKKSKLI